MGKTEEDPLEVIEGTKAINHLEDAVVGAGGAVVRYGGFYGPGARDDQVKLVRKRFFPLVGSGTGHFSWVHVDDAASATVLAVEQRATGDLSRGEAGSPARRLTLVTFPSGF